MVRPPRTTVTEPATGTAARQRVTVLTAGKVADQGALFLGSLLVARSVGPAAFAPLGGLLVFNSLSVQLSDLGLGFAVHGSPLGSRLPGRSLRTMRVAGALVAAFSVLVAWWAGNVLFAAAGVIWVTSAEAYVRKAATVRVHRSKRVLLAEVVGASSFLTLAVAAVAADVPELMGLGLVLKHLSEIGLLPVVGEVDPSGRLASHREWFGQVATFGASNADYAAVLLFLSPAAFSVYMMAFRLVGALPSVVAQALTQDTFVVLASTPRGAPLADTITHIRRRALRLSLVGAAGGVAAAVAGRLILGPAWPELVIVAVILASAMPARLLLGPTVALAISSGRSSTVIVTETFRMVLVFAGAAVGSRWGVTGSAAGAALGTTIGVLGLYRRVSRMADLGSGTRS